MPNAFAAYLAEHHTDLDGYLASFFGEERTGCPAGDDLDRFLYAPLRAFSENGGKRHRPLICLIACRAVGGDPARARSCAAAIEHFQSAALIHDDIADNGQLRRGKPCLYLTEGVGLAINCGDLDLTLVTEAVLNDPVLDDATRVRVMRELTAMTMRTIEGQALDLGWVRDERFDLGVDDYLRMATLKTAHYSGAVPLACGAIIGGGSEAQVEALRSFGLDTGLAFQIQDDLINLVGSDTAKDFRTDITEGKRTLVAVHALADPAAHDEVEAILRSGSSDPAVLARAVELFEETGSIAYAHDVAEQLIARAKTTLAGIELDEACRALLLDMADFFLSRAS
ncbi:polyprenyl synthetase family protein [[Collinsella] massiliensis]|uniref:Polyprenyl synthetase n=1 Tax=[Collinsella] massiliensis TaxID=1232426 RepID=A0A1Y3XII0_9ACTN|nr:polyprenyl synthetase family protein [[Collinsella] massiliensis]OUN85362.1 polyprenyl synthetase [[Collinsella] massiliensis]